MLPWAQVRDLHRAGGPYPIMQEDFSYIHYLASRGMGEYVLRNIKQDKDLVKTTGTLNLLLSAAISTKPEMVRMLLEAGAMPSAAVHAWDSDDEPVHGTVWSFFLLYFLQDVIDPDVIVYETDGDLFDPDRLGFLIVGHLLKFHTPQSVFLVVSDRDQKVMVDGGSQRRTNIESKDEGLKELFYMSLTQFVRLRQPSNAQSIQELLFKAKSRGMWAQTREVIERLSPWTHSDTPATPPYKKFDYDNLPPGKCELHSTYSGGVQLRPGLRVRIW